jgi:hypothetical protein
MMWQASNQHKGTEGEEKEEEQVTADLQSVSGVSGAKDTSPDDLTPRPVPGFENNVQVAISFKLV